MFRAHRYLPRATECDAARRRGDGIPIVGNEPATTRRTFDLGEEAGRATGRGASGIRTLSMGGGTGNAGTVSESFVKIKGKEALASAPDDYWPLPDRIREAACYTECSPGPTTRN